MCKFTIKLVNKNGWIIPRLELWSSGSRAKKLTITPQPLVIVVWCLGPILHMTKYLIWALLIGSYSLCHLPSSISAWGLYLTSKSEYVLSCCSSYNLPSFIMLRNQSPMNMRAFVNQIFPYPWYNPCCICVEHTYQPDTLVCLFNEYILRLKLSGKK